MTPIEVLVDAFQRVRDAVYPAVTGLSQEELTTRLDAEANTIAWLVWHLARIQDHHISGLVGGEQVWKTGGWADRMGLALDAADTGYGHGPEEVAAVDVTGSDLLGYYEEVHTRTMDVLGSITDNDLERVVDRSWDPPVTMAVRLVSVVADDLQHAGQAAYVRGVLQRH